MQEQTEQTVEGIERTNREISAGMEEITDALNEFETIEELISSVSNSIDEIATANDRQAETIEKLTVSLDEIKDQATDTESASEQIVEQTHQQQEAIRALTAAVEKMMAAESVS
jgi:methyl-accepting chemotaxis protein